MGEKSRDPFWRRNNPIMWGVLATAAVIAFGAWAANQSVCQTDFWGNQSCVGSKWSAFLAAAPNEVGDTLAGFAGALAFVWLIATVWLQGQELAAQREELREQREATQDMARAQTEQVKLLKLQGRIFEEEQRQREQSQAWEEAEEIVENIKAIASSREVRALEINWSQANIRGAMENSAPLVLSNAIESLPFDMVYQFASRFRKLALLSEDPDKTVLRTVGEKHAYVALLAVLKRLSGVYPHLSAAKQIKIDRSNLVQAIDALTELEKHF
ncbi:hypothetical protein [Phaeobacter sp. S60]|uniref:hypothetical protein n=1 Tax=Phaeobacter sp. S60 TaxID=1569353 RepID=UPI00058AC830|nr:hypothetical protein [Phaeobacter sp. S60]KII12886.1 hypothetical protein OO25_16000 [Phaeobacter sp. S60]